MFTTGHEDFRYNEWMTGMIILEILVGTDLMIQIEYLREAEELVEACSAFLDEDTEALIRYLLFDEADYSLDGYIQSLDDTHSTVIGDIIRAMDCAVIHDKVLQGLQIKLSDLDQEEMM